MQKHLTLLLLLCGTAGPRSVLASGRTAEPTLRQAAPATGRPATPGARPLVRYLTATLRLTPTQAAAVQQALSTESPRPLLPEQLAQNIGPVLSLEAQERLQSLQANAAAYRTLYYLAARH